MNSANMIGQQVDRYRIIGHIARGGMADVYLAEDVDLKRKVAIKVMLNTLVTDSQFVQRFQREAQTIAKLEHANIVRVYSVGQMPSKQPYLAMQYIDGGSLEDKLQQLADRDKLLTKEQALNVARQIAQALAVAHNARIIHRDLKPSNVLIRPDGAPVLVDLGIAVVGDGTKLTQTGRLIGTPHYMSPEQVRGKPLDGRSDLYSLGVILYEILAGMRPFEAEDSIAVLHKQVYEEPLPLDKFRQDLTPQTLLIVEMALKKDPSQRYQRAEDMVTAIDRALQAEGLHGPNPGATRVLTRLEDEALVSRHSIVRVPTAARAAPRQVMPVWAIVVLSVLVTAVVLIFLLRVFDSDNGIDMADTTVSATETAASEIAYVTAIVTGTPAPPTDTPIPAPTTELTALPTAIPINTPLPIQTNTPISSPVPEIASATPIPNNPRGVIDLGSLLAMLEINAPSNNELSVSLVNGPAVIQGQSALEMRYKINEIPDDYAGIESHGLSVTDWRNFTNLCVGIVNVNNFPGHLVVQFREQSDETWKTEIQIGNITNSEVCVPLSTARFFVHSSERNRQIDLAAINKIAFYLGHGGRVEGTIYLYSIRLKP